MIVKKLRLQRGWSQEQLSHLTGLSSRTIQRIESGQKPSMESLKSLAAVFEVNFTELQQEENTMNTETVSNSSSLTIDEILAMKYAQKLKGFYRHLSIYALVIPALIALNYFNSPNYFWAIWPILGWGIGLAFHALRVFNKFNLFGPEWEKKKIEEYLGRKL